MSGIRRLALARSCRDIVRVKLVPAGSVEEMQAASAADDLGACRERLPAGEHHPVFTSGPGTVSAELGHGKPVMAGAVAAEQRDTGAHHRQGAAALMSLCQPFMAAIADVHDREIGVIAGQAHMSSRMKSAQ